MFIQKVILVLGSSLLLSFAHLANANLLTDPDGLNISLLTDGFSTNQLGPDSFTQGYTPSDMNPAPAPMIDGSEMMVTFFESSISFYQNTVAGDLGTTLGWNMVIADIDWPSGSEIVNAYVMFDTYPIDLSVSFTSDSFTVRYDGGQSIEVGDLWEGTVVFESQQVPAPSVLIMLMLSLGVIVLRSRKW